MKTALITGCTGQDGSYLAELLLQKGYKVCALYRRTSTSSMSNVEHIKDDIVWHLGDLTDPHSLDSMVKRFQPDEIYNLGAQSFVGTSWTQPNTTAQITALGTLNLLEAVRKYAPEARFYQASSSEQFGGFLPPQNESSNFHPRSPYGAAKCYAHHITVNYRESYNMHASCGILFNHESPRRGLEFVTRKVTNTAAAIKLGRQEQLKMGSLDAVRDWGHAKDYVEAMWLMLQEDRPSDFVIATGITHTVKDLVVAAFDAVDLNWEDYYILDLAFVRPAEVNILCGNASKASNLLGWKPKITFEEMITEMVHQDLELLSAGRVHA